MLVLGDQRRADVLGGLSARRHLTIEASLTLHKVLDPLAGGLVGRAKGLHIDITHVLLKEYVARRAPHARGGEAAWTAGKTVRGRWYDSRAGSGSTRPKIASQSSPEIYSRTIRIFFIRLGRGEPAIVANT